MSYPLSEANEWIEKTNMNILKFVLKNADEEIHRHRQESENSEQLSVQIQNMAPKRKTIESVAKEIASLKSEMGALRKDSPNTPLMTKLPPLTQPDALSPTSHSMFP